MNSVKNRGPLEKIKDTNEIERYKFDLYKLKNQKE